MGSWPPLREGGEKGAHKPCGDRNWLNLEPRNARGRGWAPLTLLFCHLASPARSPAPAVIPICFVPLGGACAHRKQPAVFGLPCFCALASWNHRREVFIPASASCKINSEATALAGAGQKQGLASPGAPCFAPPAGIAGGRFYSHCQEIMFLFVLHVLQK
jgi:hypothetical protein